MPLKLTQRGRGIKDNSRRTGAGADRVAARRQGARDRFKIMPPKMWAKQHPDGNMADYDAYVTRKQVEAKALGL